MDIILDNSLYLNLTIEYIEQANEITNLVIQSGYVMIIACFYMYLQIYGKCKFVALLSLISISLGIISALILKFYSARFLGDLQTARIIALATSTPFDSLIDSATDVLGINRIKFTFYLSLSTISLGGLGLITSFVFYSKNR